MARAFLIILMTFLTTQYCLCQNTWCDYDNRYAIIIMGGQQANNTLHYGWYWGDTYRMYKRLIDKYSFDSTNIRFLSYGDSALAHANEVYDTSNVSNIINAYHWLAQNSTINDLCYIFWVDHGSPTDFLVYDGIITHATLGTLTKAIDAKGVAGAYNPCNSGALIDDVSDSNVISIASVLPTELNSFGWAGAWTTGLNGGGNSDSSDLNQDGIISFSEMFEWISPKSLAAGEHCTYDDNADGIYSIYSDLTYDPSLSNYDGNFGKNHSLSGWRCNYTFIKNSQPKTYIQLNNINSECVINIKNSNCARFILYDLKGKIVFEDILISKNGTISRKIPLYNLTNGMYIAAIENEHGFVSKKIIKQY